MKLLWITITPSLAEEKIGKKLFGGHWVKSLEKEIHKHDDIELHICFLTHYDIPHYSNKNTTYCTVKRTVTNKFEKAFNRNNYNYKSEKNVQEIVDVIKQVKPDLIHCHGTEEVQSLALLQCQDIPYAISIQGNITVYNYKFYSGIPKEHILRTRKLSDILLNRGFINQKKIFEVKEGNEQSILKNCKNIIGRTHWDRRITRVLAPESDYYEVGEVLRDQFHENKWIQPQKSRYTIFTTTGGNPYKGFEVVAYAVHLLNKTGVDFEWKLAGVSPNDDVVKAAKSYLGDNYPSKNLTLLGKLGPDQLVEHMLSSNIYSMPSHIENSPNSLCEAMLLGMPCIATLAGGSNSLLTDNHDGVLIQDGDPWVLAGAVMELKSNPELAAELGVNARETASKRHNKDYIVSQLLDCYDKILEKQK